MTKKNGIVGVDLLLYFILLLSSVNNAQEINIVQHPMNTTVCEGSTATFTCVIFFQSGIPAAPEWLRNGTFVDMDMIRHTIVHNRTNANTPAYISSTLTVSNIATSDDGIMYQCGSSTAISNTAMVDVAVDPPMTTPTLTNTTPLSNTSFTVDWTINNTNYDIIVILTNLCSEEISIITVPEYAVDTNSYNVTEGLNGIDNYIVSVATSNACGMNRSDNTTVYDPPKDAPMNVRFSNINNQSFTVQWAPVMYFFPVNYTVTWYGEDGINGTATVNGLSYNVTGLTANTSYIVTVIANDTCFGAGPVSNVVTIMTNNKPPTLPPPATTIAATTTITATPTSTADAIDEEDDSSNVGIIIGVVVAVVVVIIVVIIIIIVVVYYIKKNKDSTDGGDMQELKSPTNTSGSHTASVKPAGNVPHQTAASGEEYAVTSRVTTTKPQQQPPTQEYAVVDKGKKHAAATQGIHYADLQDLPGSGSKPPTNQGPTSTYAMVA